ncbi:MAG TPA: type II toxin-antitoxin system mRNA interferase toxin, RelE/StbE family [Ignavibacteria bacterium]|nr:type II toxin-antitoxin system mRNA interferase toxin, RelE/StbE family [Ignavibacteria bacterium]
MIKLIWDKGFKKSYKKKISNSTSLKRNFWNAVNKFNENPFDKSLRTHKLSGELKECWAFSINYEYRIIFEFIDDNTISLIDIGTHDEVY